MCRLRDLKCCSCYISGSSRYTGSCRSKGCNGTWLSRTEGSIGNLIDCPLNVTLNVYLIDVVCCHQPKMALDHKLASYLETFETVVDEISLVVFIFLC